MRNRRQTDTIPIVLTCTPEEFCAGTTDGLPPSAAGTPPNPPLPPASSLSMLLLVVAESAPPSLPLTRSSPSASRCSLMASCSL